MKQQVSLDLMSFVEREILPRYNAFGPSHGLSHVQRVIANALKLVDATGADINMVYAIAAYHDLGMSGPRAIHHLTGGKILAADARLRHWFSQREPRSIYGKIIAEADRDLTPEVVFQRAVMFGLENYPTLTKEEQWHRFEKHMEEKYSTSGYLRLWIPNSPNAAYLRRVREVIADRQELRKVFDRYYAESK